jgi:hypothetical protein
MIERARTLQSMVDAGGFSAVRRLMEANAVIKDDAGNPVGRGIAIDYDPRTGAVVAQPDGFMPEVNFEETPEVREITGQDLSPAAMANAGLDRRAVAGVLPENIEAAALQEAGRRLERERAITFAPETTRQQARSALAAAFLEKQLGLAQGVPDDGRYSAVSGEGAMKRFVEPGPAMLDAWSRADRTRRLRGVSW